jgi:hypothetical protein
MNLLLHCIVRLGLFNRMQKHNLHREYRLNGWRPQEEEIIKRCFPKGGVESVMPRLHRSRHAVFTHASIMGMKRVFEKQSWTSKEDEYIRLHCETDSDEEIARILQRKVLHVANRRRQMHLYRFRGDGWTDVEIELLEQNYHTTPSIEFAYKFGRSQNSITKMAQKLGIHKHNIRNTPL